MPLSFFLSYRGNTNVFHTVFLLQRYIFSEEEKNPDKIGLVAMQLYAFIID